jgi:hypothetical protein
MPLDKAPVLSNAIYVYIRQKEKSGQLAKNEKQECEAESERKTKKHMWQFT